MKEIQLEQLCIFPEISRRGTARYGTSPAQKKNHALGGGKGFPNRKEIGRLYL